MEHGIFELPLNLKRSHFSYAHTRRRRRPAARGDRGGRHAPCSQRGEPSPSPARSTSPRPAARSAGSRSRSRRTPAGGRTSSSRSRRSRTVDGPTVLVLGGNHGDEYEGQVAGLKLAPGARSRSRCTGRVIVIPCLSTEASKAGTRLWPYGVELQPLVPRAARRAGERAARGLPHARALPALRRRHRHAHRRQHRALPPVLAHARRRRPRAAAGDARGDASVEHATTTTSTSTSPAAGCCRSRQSARGRSSSRPSSGAAATSARDPPPRAGRAHERAAARGRPRGRGRSREMNPRVILDGRDPANYVFAPSSGIFETLVDPAEPVDRGPAGRRGSTCSSSRTVSRSSSTRRSTGSRPASARSHDCEQGDSVLVFGQPIEAASLL